MQYGAIIFDLDGTAIPNIQNTLPSPRMIAAIEAARPHFKLCAATGRAITNAKAIIQSLELVDPCIISAGTQIVNPRTSEILWEYAIEPADVPRILAICSPYPYELLVREELLGQGSPAATHQIDGAVNVMYLMRCNDADTKVIMQQLANIPTISASGVLSWTGEYTDIHITHRNATKEHAIAKLLEIIEVTKEKTIGVGDANNDVHLFKGVGLKVAMGNATDLLKSQADVMCGMVDNDGLAVFIEELIARK